MTAKNKRRGNDFEREVVKTAEALGLDAVRAWVSDGRSRDWPAGVDVKISDLAFQCKRRRQLAKYLVPDDDTFGVLTRQDGDLTAYALIRLVDLLVLIRALMLFGWHIEELKRIEEER